MHATTTILAASQKEAQQMIRENLAENDSWVTHAVARIHDYQTKYEQQIGTTALQNNVGFNSADGTILSDYAEQIKRGRRLSPRQLEIARQKISKYSRQILILIQEKASVNAA